MRDVVALEDDLAAARRIEADDRIHQRGLADAVAAEQAEDLALLELQRQALQHVGVAVIGMDVLDFENGHGVSRSPDRFPAPVALEWICCGVPVSRISPKCRTEICRGDVEHHVHVVLDQQDREFRIELHQELGHLGGFARRQAGGRLVKQQDLRIAGEAEHDFELALLAVRQVADFGVLAVEEVRLFEQMMGLVVDVLVRRQEAPHHEFRRPQALDRQQHVVEHGEFRKQAGDLERARHAERGAPVARPVGDILAEQQDLPGRHRIDAGDQIEQRGLAGAVRADDGLAVARHDAQRDVARGLQAAEALAQVP